VAAVLGPNGSTRVRWIEKKVGAEPNGVLARALVSDPWSSC
jgi:hypothetical protein